MEGNFPRAYDIFYGDVMFLEKDISANIYPELWDVWPRVWSFSSFDKIPFVLIEQ